jgi:histidinol-phosphatase (PHP family)
MGVEKVIGIYFEGLLEAMDSLAGDVLCHLDAVLRHYQGVRFTDEHRQLIVEILERLRRKGMALEVNTSGFPLRQEPFPALDFLRQAIQQGVPLVAGSDAHRPEEVGRHFEQLPWLLARAVTPG